jgi:hypothetical protein
VPVWIKNLLNGSQRRQFLAIFVLTFLYKLLFAWRTGVSVGWQDEIAWKTHAASEGLLKTITLFDAGYPTPLLRTFSFVLAQFTTNDFTLWHVCILLIISGSIASLAYSRIIAFNDRYVLAGLVCSYPSFDLLLLHNLSYWTFIPLFVLLSNVLYGKKQINSVFLVFAFVLITFTAKPQLLIAVAVPLVCVGVMNRRINKSVFILIALIGLIVVIGRTSENPLGLELDLNSVVNLILTINSHFFNVVAPVLVLGSYAISKYFNSFGFVFLTLMLPNILAFSKWFKLIVYSKDAFQIKILYFSFFLSAAGLYFFPNSGWSQNNLFSSNVYTSLFSRHYLPIILVAGLLLLIIFREGKWAKFLLSFATIQNIFLQVYLFHQLYAPI